MGVTVVFAKTSSLVEVLPHGTREVVLSDVDFRRSFANTGHIW
jgi:hypothetical protein